MSTKVNTGKLTKKQFLKRKTLFIAGEIHKALTGVTPGPNDLDKFPKVTHYRSSDSGEIRVGLSLRGIRLLIKKHPLITPEQVMEVFNVTPLVTEAPLDTEEA